MAQVDRRIGTIVKSSSQVEYVCRVFGFAEVEPPPGPADYAFGTFVRMELPPGDGCLVGLVYNTVLANPEFGNRGPRLSPPPDLEIFSPDYLNERGVLVSLFAVGRLSAGGAAHQGVPLPSAELGTVVTGMGEGEVRAFHRPGGDLALAYAPLLLAHRDPLMPHLLLRVLDRLQRLFPGEERRLAVLRGNLAWKTAVAPAG